MNNDMHKVWRRIIQWTPGNSPVSLRNRTLPSALVSVPFKAAPSKSFFEQNVFTISVPWTLWEYYGLLLKIRFANFPPPSTCHLTKIVQTRPKKSCFYLNIRSRLSSCWLIILNSSEQTFIYSLLMSRVSSLETGLGKHIFIGEINSAFVS